MAHFYPLDREKTHIIEAIQANRVRIIDHADEEVEADKLTFDEV